MFSIKEPFDRIDERRQRFYQDNDLNQIQIYDNEDFETNRNTSKNSNFSKTNDSSSERSIYSHFTTAIDTNNIKTIFEMVRLMIFEKNCKAIMLN
jgi:hypothetical protein